MDRQEDMDVSERCYDRPSVEGVLGGLSIAFGLTAVFATLSFMYWDLNVAKWAAGLPQWFYVTMDWLTETGEGWVWMVPTGGLAAWYLLLKKDRKIGLTWLVAFGVFAGTGLLTNLLKVLIGRYRPKAYFREMEFGFDPMSVGYVVNSMPSGHSTTMGAVLVVFWLYFPRWRWLSVPCALLVASTRVWVRAHYISDVLTGLLVGGGVTFLIYYLVVGARWVEAPAGWKKGPGSRV